MNNRQLKRIEAEQHNNMVAIEERLRVIVKRLSLMNLPDEEIENRAAAEILQELELEDGEENKRDDPRTDSPPQGDGQKVEGEEQGKN